MRAVLQRVSKASVTVDDQVVGSIASGWMVLLGVGQEDEEADAHYIADKILNIRGFSDNDGKMNLSVADISGSVLLVSQFTLWGDSRKGRRPGFSQAAPPARAQELYHLVRDLLRKAVPVETGTFQAHMEVALVNDGPVTLLIDSKKTF